MRRRRIRAAYGWQQSKKGINWTLSLNPRKSRPLKRIKKLNNIFPNCSSPFHSLHSKKKKNWSTYQNWDNLRPKVREKKIFYSPPPFESSLKFSIDLLCANWFINPQIFFSANWSITFLNFLWINLYNSLNFNFLRLSKCSAHSTVFLFFILPKKIINVSTEIWKIFGFFLLLF